MTAELQFDPETGIDLRQPDVPDDFRNDWGAGQSSVMGPVDVVPRFKTETASEYLERMAKRTDDHARKLQAQKRAARWATVGLLAKEVITTLMQLAGFAIVAYGLFTWTPWVGIVFAGLGLILVSVAIDPPKRRIQLRRPSPSPQQGGGDPGIQVAVARSEGM